MSLASRIAINSCHRLPGLSCVGENSYSFSCSFVFEKGTAFASARFFAFSSPESFRKCMLKLPSRKPSSSIYPPAIRSMQVRLGVIRLVSSSISSLLIILSSPFLKKFPVASKVCFARQSVHPRHSQLLLLMKRRSLRVLVIPSVPESLFSDNFSCFLNGLII